MTSEAIIVVGGGPAGCVVAMGLVAAGRPVTLVTRPRRGRLHEGLSQRVIDGLRFAGCDHALAAVGPWVERQAHWNGRVSRANGEFVTVRRELDAAVLEDARRAGVEVVKGRVKRIAYGDDGCRVEWVGAAGEPVAREAAFAESILSAGP